MECRAQSGIAVTKLLQQPKGSCLSCCSFLPGYGQITLHSRLSIVLRFVWQLADVRGRLRTRAGRKSIHRVTGFCAHFVCSMRRAGRSPAGAGVKAGLAT
jgi:hypothetical protein